MSFRTRPRRTSRWWATIGLFVGFALFAFGQDTKPEEKPAGTAPAPAPAATTPEAETAAPAEAPKPEESETPAPAPAPSAPPAQKSLDQYAAAIRDALHHKEFTKVGVLCDEAEKLYPDDTRIIHFRSQLKLNIEAAKSDKGRHILPVPPNAAPAASQPGAQPSSGTEAASTPVPTEGAKPVVTKPAAAPPARPIPVTPPKESASGGRSTGTLWTIAIGAGLVGGLAIVILGIALGRGRKSDGQPAYAGPERRGRQRRGSTRASSLERRSTEGPGTEETAPTNRMPQPISSAIPAAVPKSLESPTETFAPPQQIREATEELFREDPAGESQGDEDIGDFNIFDEPASKSAKPAAKTAADTPGAKKPPSRDLDSSAIISFDTSTHPEQSSEAPWKKDEELESIPSMKLDMGSPPVGARGKGMPDTPKRDRAPWETDSATATAKSDSSKMAGDDSLPLLPSDAEKPREAVTPVAKGTSKASAPPIPDLDLDYEFHAPPLSKPAEPRGIDLEWEPPASESGEKASKGSPEISFKGMKSPEAAETITDLNQSAMDETLPGLDLPALGEMDTVPPGKGIFLPPSSPGMEKTVRLSRKELQRDPDLILEAAPKPDAEEEPAMEEEGVEVFRADETIHIDLSEREINEPPMDLEVTVRDAGVSSKPTAGDAESFEREREMGFNAFKKADWEQAVYHLSIASTLQPEAPDVKEQLRRARRMRKEREG